MSQHGLHTYRHTQSQSTTSNLRMQSMVTKPYMSKLVISTCLSFLFHGLACFTIKEAPLCFYIWKPNRVAAEILYKAVEISAYDSMTLFLSQWSCISMHKNVFFQHEILYRFQHKITWHYLLPVKLYFNEQRCIFSMKFEHVSLSGKHIAAQEMVQQIPFDMCGCNSYPSKTAQKCLMTKQADGPE
jgi:hypothetical protein